MNYALDPKNIDTDSLFRPVVDMVSTAKEIVTTLKHIQTQNKLETTLKQMVSMRRNSTLIMLKSVANNLESLRTAGAETNHRSLQKSLLDVNDDLLLNIINVLELFYTATRLVSADQTPTIHLVVPVRMQLLKGVKVCAGDVETKTPSVSQQPLPSAGNTLCDS